MDSINQKTAWIDFEAVATILAVLVALKQRLHRKQQKRQMNYLNVQLR